MSRKDDPAVREREHALQSLDLAYHKYREIRRNLDEGYKVCLVSLSSRATGSSILPSFTTTLLRFYSNSKRPVKLGRTSESWNFSEFSCAHHRADWNTYKQWADRKAN